MIDEATRRTLAIEALRTIVDHCDDCGSLYSKHTANAIAALPAALGMEALESLTAIHESIARLEDVIQRIDRLAITH